jgi:hypothetical protein
MVMVTRRAMPAFASEVLLREMVWVWVGCCLDGVGKAFRALTVAKTGQKLAVMTSLTRHVFIEPPPRWLGNP